MNKIAILGHTASSYPEVESLLTRCGMTTAHPSRRENLLPRDIAAMLCKAHKTPSLRHVTTEEEICQIDAGPVWHGMALDLFLGNLESDLWGWSDTQTIFLLDYWKALDPKITFVLVYDAPQSALTHNTWDEETEPSVQSIQQKLNNWRAYNGALLGFFLRNPDRCLLVNVQQVRKAASTYINQVQTRIGAPLHAAESTYLSVSNPDTHSNAEIVSTGADAVRPQNQDSESTDLVSAESLNHLTPEAFLLESLMNAHPDCRQLYQELESAANLPSDQQSERHFDSAEAWMAWTKERSQYRMLIGQLEEAHKNQTQELLAATSAYEIEQVKWVTEKAALEQSRQLLENSLQENSKEQELMLEQLHQVQEQLEHEYLQAREYSKSVSDFQLKTDQLKTQLSESEARAKTLSAEKTLLEQQQALSIKEKAELTKARDTQAKQTAETKAALEQQLAHWAKEKTELAKARDAQASQAVDAKAALEQQRTQFAKEKSELAKLREAQTVASSKSTELQNIKEENDLLLNQLHQVQEELERYYLENQRLKTKPSLAAKKEPVAHYGAAERIKRQLSYRLGATMIERSRSLGGVLSMPWALTAETRAFRRETTSAANTKLPPIHQYRDAHEAERVKNHLSYRLGSTLIQHSKSPLGWIKLPLAIRREVRTFQQQRKEKRS